MSPTRLREIYLLARRWGVQPHKYEELSDLIHAIQRAEGNVACFATGKAATCDQCECRWRAECMAMAGVTPPDSRTSH